MIEYKIAFCTFADKRMRGSLVRIESQAKEMCFFDKIFINNEKKLERKFRKEFGNLLNSKVRGYGYWVWKPEIISQAITQVEFGDLVLYADAGCHLNKNGVDILKSYCEKLAASDAFVAAFQLSGEYLEQSWTKGDLLDYFGVRKKESISETPQIAATAIIVKKTSKLINFLSDWLKVYRTNLNLVDDSQSISSNHETFKENRHDQSIFSILCKRDGALLFPYSDIYSPGNWEKLANYPILAKRDRPISLPFHQRTKRKITSFFRRNR